jgi:hypothetical protein
VRAYLAIAARVAKDDRAAAAAMVRQALEAASREDEKLLALRAMGELGEPGLLPTLTPLLNEGEGRLRVGAGQAAMGVGDRLVQQGKPEQAIDVFQQVLKVGDRDLVTQAAARLLKLGVVVDPAKEIGFITRWWIVGPFDNAGNSAADKAYLPEQEIDLTKPFTVEGKSYTWRWQPISDATGVQNLTPLFSPNTNVVAYAYTEITVLTEQDALLKLGSDDGIVVWVNGQQVHRNIAGRAVSIDQDTAKVHLVKGKNTVLLKILQGGGDWGYVLRLAKPDGATLMVEQPEAPKTP